MPPPSADQSAIDFVRAGPTTRGDERERRRICQAGGHPPTRRATNRTRPTERRRREAKREPSSTEDEHELAPVAVAEGTEVEGRMRPGRGNSRRDEIERGLRESNASPMSGSATFMTERLRFATPATRMSATRTSPARSGLPSSPPAGASDALIRRFHHRQAALCIGLLAPLNA